MSGMAQTKTVQTKAPLRLPTRQRALYDDKDVSDANLRYQGSVSFTGAKALESCRTFLSQRTGRTMARVSDADLFDFLARCWRNGEDKALADLRTRGHIK